MHSFTQTLLAMAGGLSVAHAQGVIISAVGNTGTSVGMQVEVDNYADANYINQAEIEANAVNACGRTFLAGDISEAGVTEELLEAGTYTTVSKSGTITMIISQRYSNGTGPFTCDLDESSNALGAYGQTNLTVTEDSSEYGTGNLTLSIALPSDLACIGGSTGNMCTVRCVNSYSFGGCITVQQTDVTANVNTVDNIETAEEATAIAAQVTQNQKDLPAAEAGLASVDTTSEEAKAVVEAILAQDTSIDAAAANVAVASTTTTMTTTSTATSADSTATTTKKSKAEKAAAASSRKASKSAARASKSAASASSAAAAAAATVARRDDTTTTAATSDATATGTASTTKTVNSSKAAAASSRKASKSAARASKSAARASSSAAAAAASATATVAARADSTTTAASTTKTVNSTKAAAASSRRASKSAARASKSAARASSSAAAAAASATATVAARQEGTHNLRWANRRNMDEFEE